MSHFTKITAQIKDLEALTVAAKKMGFSVAQNANCRYYFGAEKREFVIKLPGAYDVAVTKEDDHYTLEADFYGSHVSTYVGHEGGLLMQKYAAEKAKIEAFKNGLGVTEKTVNDLLMLTMTDPDSGGQIIVECSTDGETQVRTSGFQGQGCMKFRNIEEALGVTEKITHTDEFFVSEPETAVEVVHTYY